MINEVTIFKSPITENPNANVSTEDTNPESNIRRGSFVPEAIDYLSKKKLLNRDVFAWAMDRAKIQRKQITLEDVIKLEEEIKEVKNEEEIQLRLAESMGENIRLSGKISSIKVVYDFDFNTRAERIRAYAYTQRGHRVILSYVKKLFGTESPEEKKQMIDNYFSQLIGKEITFSKHHYPKFHEVDDEGRILPIKEENIRYYFKVLPTSLPNEMRKTDLKKIRTWAKSNNN